jgi:hypothetical protein
MTPANPPGKETLTGSVRSDSMSATAPKHIIRFPSERTSHPVRNGASWIDIGKGRLRACLGHMMNWFGLPGAISAAEIDDHSTGQHVAVAVDAHFVRLTVNGRDFYFDRLTGRYDGAGSGLS